MGTTAFAHFFRFQPIQRTIVMACFWVNMRCPFSYPRFASRLFQFSVAAYPTPQTLRRTPGLGFGKQFHRKVAKFN